MSEQQDTTDMKSETQDLPFYLHDYEEQKCRFVTFRLQGNLSYSDIISADFSQNERQLSDQFENISNELQKLNFLVRSSSLILSNSGIKSFNASVKTTSDIYEAYHQQSAAEDASLKSKLIVNLNSK